MLMSNWQLLAGVAAAILVFLIIFAIFYKCNLFSKVRVKKDELEKAKAQAEGRDGAEKLLEVDGENVELR